MTISAAHAHSAGDRLRCTAGGAMCLDDAPGHALGLMQLRLAAATPGLWRDGLVVDVLDVGVVVQLVGGPTVLYRHHADLRGAVGTGAPVAVHERYLLLAAGDERFSVAL